MTILLYGYEAMNLFHFTGIYLLSKVSLPIVLFGLLTVLLTGEFIECINTNSFNELTETLCSILVKCLEQLTKATGEIEIQTHTPRLRKLTLYRLSYRGLLEKVANLMNLKVKSVSISSTYI